MPAPISEYVPQSSPEEAARRRRAGLWAWGAALGAVGLVAGLILLAPLARSRGAAALSGILYYGFKPVCHQMAERSFHLEGFPLAVCARCAGLYAGALLGLLVYPLARSLAGTGAPARAWILAAAIPTTADFALGVLGVVENTHLSRFLTASLLGAASAFYVLPAAVELLAARLRPRARGASAAEAGVGLRHAAEGR